jgi:biotin carboxyl carrier protein
VPDAGRRRERHEGGKDGGPDDGRLADHAAIVRLTDELLPALIAKLSTTQLGELEVREGDWHVRLRRPFGVVAGEGRRATDRPSRVQPGHEGHGHGRAAVEGHRPGRSTGAVGAAIPASGVTAGSGAASAASNGSGAARAGARKDREGGGDLHIATSPAVGIFNPGPRATSGTRVRAGDSLGAVDVLGVPQDVAAPADGVVGSTLVEAGMAVEYGQALIRLELTALASSGPGDGRSS